MMRGEEGQEEVKGGGETVLPVASYPDLDGAEEGQKVMLTGTVKSNDGENVTITYDSVKVEQNMADKAISGMTGRKPAPAMAPAEGEEDEY